MGGANEDDVLGVLLGEDPLRLIDVGARDGIASRWEPYFRLLQVCAFEPDPEECNRLNARASGMPYPIQFLPKALGAMDGQSAILNICRQPGCSSLLQPNQELCRGYPYSANMEVVKTWPITLSRLDTVVAENGFRPDVIKVDTQGTELDILRGAGSLIDDMLVVELEVEFVAQYVDQAQFSDVDLFMREKGFVLRGLKRSYWRLSARPGWPKSARGGQLLHGDALYVNGMLASRDATLPAVTMLKGLVALSAYEQDDLVLEILSRPHPALSGLSEVRRRALARALVAKPLSGVRRVLSKALSVAGYTNRRLRRGVDELREVEATDWHDADFY